MDNSFGSLEEALKEAGVTQEWIDKVKREALRGYVYIIKCNDLYKIGCSRDGVEKRVKAMQTGNPYALELVKKLRCDDYPKVEALLHEYFKQKHVKGEWFRLTDIDLKRINGLVEKG